ncbi:MAG TPA: ATP-binding cassette domain-containing protein [Limnobacter sp.]|nr:ATP-binding cassette domain-containing protein [Limnobacter sp.]
MMHTDALLTPSTPCLDLLPIVMEKVGLAFRGHAVFQGLDLDIATAGITAIMGPNGAGKSLLLRVMAGLVPPDSGRILFGQHVRLPPHALGFVFQRPVLLRRSVQDNLRHALALAGHAHLEAQWRASALLGLGDLAHLAQSPARSLSGGEQQRLTMLRALACAPSLLLLDEPSASLDPQATATIERLIRRACACGVKVIVVTHDAGQASRLADEVIFLHQGQVLEKTPTRQFLAHAQSPQARAYLAGELLID